LLLEQHQLAVMVVVAADQLSSCRQNKVVKMEALAQDQMRHLMHRLILVQLLDKLQLLMHQA
jgi:hypothetical protein